VGSSSTVGSEGSDAYMDSIPDSVVDSSPADGGGRESYRQSSSCTANE
jgi:hypothetical protein